MVSDWACARFSQRAERSEARAEAKSKTQLAKGHLQARRGLCCEVNRAGWLAPGV